MGHNATREALKAFFPKSRNWALKVDRMHDAQVVATYFRMFHEEAKKHREKQ